MIEHSMNAPLDFTQIWTWFLLWMRMTGLFLVLPGIGTEEVPITFRASFTLVLALVLTIAGAHATLPSTLAEGGLMMCAELFLGFVLGIVPYMIVSAFLTSGQINATAIGLAQANMIDPSLGVSVTVLARLQGLIATAIFLAIDGHHAVIRAAASLTDDFGLGMFRPNAAVTQVFIERFVATFETAIVFCGPILATTIVTQFVLGLMTKFVPQINVFIMSLPLTILIGLFITAFTFPAISSRLVSEFGLIEEILTRLMHVT